MTIIKTPAIISDGESSVQYIDETGEGKEVLLFSLYVHPNQRGCYLGHELIKQAINDILSKGYQHIFLTPKTKSLVSYYEKVGFVLVDNANEMYLRGGNS